MVRDKMIPNPHNTKSWNVSIHLKTAAGSIYQGFQVVVYSLYIMHIKSLLKMQWNIYISVRNPWWEDERNQDIVIFQCEFYIENTLSWQWMSFSFKKITVAKCPTAQVGMTYLTTLLLHCLPDLSPSQE